MGWDWPRWNGVGWDRMGKGGQAEDGMRWYGIGEGVVEWKETERR